MLFGLVGLQLQPILDELQGYSWQELVGYAALVSAVVMVIRIVYGFPVAYIPRWVSPALRERDPAPPWQFVAFIAWAGMRGGVTLAAALAIPLTTDSGAPFPDRSLIIFLAFSVVLATLVLQGLSLPAARPPARARGGRRRRHGGGEGANPRRRGRRSPASRSSVDEDWVREDTAERVRGPTTSGAAASRRGWTTRTTAGSRSARQPTSACAASCSTPSAAPCTRCRNEGKISEDVMHRVQRDLDLEDSRLDV